MTDRDHAARGPRVADRALEVAGAARAAYEVLGLDWDYDAIEVGDGGLAAFLGRARTASWRGLSLTMPLKREVLPLLSTRRPAGRRQVGAANTVLLPRTAPRGFNTDVAGIVAAFREAGVDQLDDRAGSRRGSDRRVGAGRRACSSVPSRALVSARDPAAGAVRCEPMAGEPSGSTLTIRPLGMMDRSLHRPRRRDLDPARRHRDRAARVAEAVRAESVLFDVAYDPWPSALAASWARSAGPWSAG